MTNKPAGADLSVNIGKLKLKNPVITCSGTFASGIEYNNFYDISLLGAVTTKSFSFGKISGNTPPRICETPSGMLNSIGLQNEGIDYFINNHLEFIKRNNIDVILSIFGKSPEEFIQVSEKVKQISEDIIAVELNFSCPNMEEDGISFSAFPEKIKIIVKEVKRILNLNIISKLSPNFDTIMDCAYASKEGGAEAVSLINTVSGAAFNIETFKPKIGNIIGGLSGPAVKPIAVLKIFQLAKKNILPIIGMGGIYSWEDAVEFMIAGASAVGVGTANFVDPKICLKILDGIKDFIVKKNIYDIKKIIGAVLNAQFIENNKNND